MNLQSYNSKAMLPSYLDGFFEVYEIIADDSVNYPKESLKCTSDIIYFNELSLTDSLKISSSERKINIVKKIRISQNRELDARYVLKIGQEYYSIFNSYHFANKDGFLESDLSLTSYQKDVNILEASNDEKRI